jgi:DNA-binding GntR family transcriptional regulator
MDRIARSEGAQGGRDDEQALSARRVLRSQGFVDEAFTIIRADLMSLRIKPDSRVSIDQLARELGVSQTPIREALSMLEAIGLVVRRHHAGYWSTPQLTRDQIDDLFELRLLLEPFAASMAASRMTDNELADLRSHLAAMDCTDHPLPYDVYADKDAELHDLIARGSRNSVIRDTLHRLHAHLHIFRLRSTSQVTTSANREHRSVAEALFRRDPAGAQAAMREHIAQSYQRLTKPLDSESGAQGL